jgi:hypothetical protein
MTRTLADQLEDDLYNVQLNVNEFAEWITYSSSVSRSRRIVALVVNKTEVAENEMATYEDEVLTVTVGNDETHAKGGVGVPRFNADRATETDTMIRDGDAITIPFVFTGKSQSIKGGWILEFKRPRSHMYGQSRARR